jgi:hypothetical protein
MGRPKKIKVVESNEQVTLNDSAVQSELSPLVKDKEPEIVLCKTMNKKIVSMAMETGFEIVHISGYGSKNNPKIWFLKGDIDKLFKKISKDEQDYIEPAVNQEIQDRIKHSKEQGLKDYANSGVHKRQLNAEIKPSEFYA